MFPVLITGGAQRLGLHCANRLVEKGFPVIVTYRKERDYFSDLEAKGICLMFADFSTSEGIADFASRVKARQQGLRGIIHNASSWLTDESVDMNRFDELMNVHVKAPWYLNTQLAPLLEKAERADVIHVTDYNVLRGSEEHIAYIATKAAMESLTLSFAKKLAPSVRVNSIAPALIKFKEEDGEEYRRSRLKKSLLGIEPGEEEFFRSVWYLMESNYTTGTSIVLNGGRHLVF